MTKLRAFALAPLFALIVSTAPSGEALTTWRAGDAIFYRTACHAEEDILRVGRAENPYELGDRLIRQGRCFTLPIPVRAVMVRWIAGPFTMPEGVAASAWEILDQFADTEFVLMNNLGGAHAAQQDAS